MLRPLATIDAESANTARGATKRPSDVRRNLPSYFLPADNHPDGVGEGYRSGEQRIGRNFQIELKLGASKASDAGFTGRLGREPNSNSIDDGLGSLTRASYQRVRPKPVAFQQRVSVRGPELREIHVDYEERKKEKGRNRNNCSQGKEPNSSSIARARAPILVTTSRAEWVKVIEVLPRIDPLAMAISNSSGGRMIRVYTRVITRPPIILPRYVTLNRRIGGTSLRFGRRRFIDHTATRFIRVRRVLRLSVIKRGAQPSLSNLVKCVRKWRPCTAENACR